MIPDLIERITPDWHLYAKCHPDEGHDPELWFPVGSDVESSREAKDICRTCPVRDTCLQWAIDNGQEHGIYGGLTPGDRSHLANAKRQDCAICSMPFAAVRGARYCSSDCRRERDRQRNRAYMAARKAREGDAA